MESLVLLSVLAIMHTTVLARPADINSKTKRSIEDSSEIFSPLFVKFPTDIRHGFTLTINGTLDITNNTLEVVFPATNKEEKDHCRITYDFVTKKVNVTPEPPGENNFIDYDIFGEMKPVDYPTFSIKLRARSMNKNSMFKLSLEANSAGESQLMSCPVENFEDYGYMEFRNGVHNITSLLFEF